MSDQFQNGGDGTGMTANGQYDCQSLEYFADQHVVYIVSPQLAHFSRARQQRGRELVAGNLKGSDS